METPTISKTQKKSTLSGKKAKPKETVKNVVATPYKNSYWPQISTDDHELLKVILQNNLPRIKPTEANIPWRVLRSIPKSDRKRFRNEYRKNGKVQIIKEDRNGFILGINDVTKLLEKDSISAILIANNVQPRIMVRHIIDEAVLYRVPIIVFDDLRHLLSKICGVTSAAVGISKNIDSRSKLNLVTESIKQVFEKYPPPLNHINYKRSLSEALEDSQSVEDNSAFSKNEEPNVMENINELDIKLESEIYLKRDSNSKRVFVPETSTEHVKVHRMEVDSTGFLPFSKTSTPKIEDQQVKANYRSLIVRRLKGDPNRSKRKIASLKRKLEK